jgi:hypothetical protein
MMVLPSKALLMPESVTSAGARVCVILVTQSDGESGYSIAAGGRLL